jgi:hypothetical protein
MLPMQPGDIPATYADVEDLMRDIGFRPSTKIEDGIARFARWHREYHNLFGRTNPEKSSLCNRAMDCAIVTALPTGGRSSGRLRAKEMPLPDGPN